MSKQKEDLKDELPLDREEKRMLEVQMKTMFTI